MTSKISFNCSRHVTQATSRVQSLAVRTAALADDIDALHRVIRSADDEPVRLAGFRCSAAVGRTRQISDELWDTAEQLERIAATTKPGACAVPWSVCPKHGNTLISAGRKSWCQAPECGRTWPYYRVGLPCVETAQRTVTEQHGASMMMRDGRALEACKRLDGAWVELEEELA